jgi:hypothetical protein
MFKYYLTYSLALEFHRSIQTLDESTAASPISVLQKERLLRSAEQLTHHFSKAIHARDPKEAAKNLYVTLVSLRDIRDSLNEFAFPASSLRLSWEVLHGRLEQICLDYAEGEGGQLRMLG